MSVLAGECGHSIEVPVTHAQATGCTVDCPECDALLLVTDASGTARFFHAVMNERNPLWPADGAGTGFIEV